MKYQNNTGKTGCDACAIWVGQVARVAWSSAIFFADTAQAKNCFLQV